MMSGSEQTRKSFSKPFHSRVKFLLTNKSTNKIQWLADFGAQAWHLESQGAIIMTE